MSPIRVWIFDLARCTADPSLLSREEHAQAARFRFEADRRRYSVARTLLRRLLGDALRIDPAAIVFSAGPQGKPLLEGIHFNVSHSGDRVAIAIGDRPVGIDVEEISRRVETAAIADRYFNPSECAWIAAQPDPCIAFFRMWAMKESVMKADGRGMSLHLHAIVVDPETHRAVAEGRTWQLEELDAGEAYRACVATPPGAVVEIKGDVPPPTPR